MPAGHVDLAQAVPHPVRCAQIRPGNRRHAHNRVHGGADIVGHGGEKVGLGGVCHPGRLVGLLQRPPLPALLGALLGHVQADGVEGGDAVPALLPAHVAQRDGDNPLLARAPDQPHLVDQVLPGLPDAPQPVQHPLQVVRVDVAALGVELAFKLLGGIADHLQEVGAVPEDGAHVPGVQPGQAAGDGPQQRRPLPVLLGQLVLRAVHIVGQLNPGSMPVPVHNAVFDHEGPLQHRVVKLPLVPRVIGKPVVGAEGAGRRPALYDLVALAPAHLLAGALQRAGGLPVDVEQLVAVHVADVDVSRVLVHHHPEIPVPLPAACGQFAHVGEHQVKDGAAVRPPAVQGGGHAQPGGPAVPPGGPAGPGGALCPVFQHFRQLRLNHGEVGGVFPVEPPQRPHTRGDLRLCAAQRGAEAPVGPQEGVVLLQQQSAGCNPHPV